jgi:CheY-like chemotaxis protein
MKKVLVIDDEPLVARLMTEVLKMANLECRIDYCSDGGQGRAKAAQGKYDLISLDLAMPLMDGFEALEEIKRNPKSNQTPVVVVTGRLEAALHERAMQMGAAAVVTKPFNVWDLGNTLRLILAKQDA